MERVKEQHRKAMRLKEYDYSRVGAYFVTICTQGKVCLFGNVLNAVMKMNDAGRMAEKWWVEIEHGFDNVTIDEYVVMPNHFHGIVMLTDSENAHTDGNSTRASEKDAHVGAPLQRVVQWYKTMTTNEYIRGVRQKGWEPFPGKLWQRSYYDHIIRNDDELNLARRYITGNPALWLKDKYNV